MTLGVKDSLAIPVEFYDYNLAEPKCLPASEIHMVIADHWQSLNDRFQG